MLDRPAPKSNLTEQQEQWLSDKRADFTARNALLGAFVTQICGKAREENFVERLRAREAARKLQYQTATGNERLNMETERDNEEDREGSFG